MNRLMRTAVSVAILGTSAWLAGAAGAAIHSGLNCPTGRSTQGPSSNSAKQAYSRAARRDRLREWRKRRQEWRGRRGWSVPRQLALRPDLPRPYGRPAWADQPSSAGGPSAYERPRVPRGLDFQWPPELRSPPFAGRFPAPPSLPDYPGSARFARPPGYLYGYPPLDAYTYGPRLSVSTPRREAPPKSLDPGQAFKGVHSQGPRYGDGQLDAGVHSPGRQASKRSARLIRL